MGEGVTIDLGWEEEGRGEGEAYREGGAVLAAGTAGGLGAEERETSGSSGVGRGGGIASIFIYLDHVSIW